jgi:hypothetical protein
MYTVANLKDDLTGALHGTSLNKINGLTNLIWRAARNVLTILDPDETIKSAQISNAVSDEIYDYLLPADLKGQKIIDIRPQVNRNAGDRISGRFSETFDISKKNNTFAIKNDSGVKSLRLSKSITPAPKTLHSMDSITDNGTWAVGGDASNLTRDNVDYVSGAASLNFDLTGAGTSGYIENSTLADVDLEDEDELSSIFVRVYIPDTSIITNFILRWGNDSSNYWADTVTAPHDQTTFKTGWNILRFDWNGATETGTVDPKTIDYLRFTVTYTATAETDIRVDKIACSLGQIWEIEYYSKYLFRSTAGTWMAEPTDDGDIVNLDEDGYNILLNELAYLASQQLQGEDSSVDADFFREELYGKPATTASDEKIGLYDIYKEDHPSQAKKPRETYYDIRR